MNGKIDKFGALQIERAGKMKTQECIHKTYEDRQVDGRVFNCPSSCCDVCPLFGEPEETEVTCLSLCHQTYLCFEKFTDERGKE